MCSRTPGSRPARSGLGFQLLDFGGDEDWNVTNTDAHSGSFSATDLGNKLIVQEIDPIPTEDILELSLWVKNPEVAINAFFFAYSDGSDEQSLIFHSSLTGCSSMEQTCLTGQGTHHGRVVGLPGRWRRSRSHLHR